MSTRGYSQCIDNNWNYAVYAQDPSVSIFQNEYNAGFVQGKVQTNHVNKATRNNTWRWYVLDEGPGANSTEIPPGGLGIAGSALVENYNYLTAWASENKDDAKAASIIRLMFRMLGIYHGAADREPLKEVKFEDLLLSSMSPEDARLYAGDDPLSFLDVIFINTQYDLFDCIGDKIGLVMGYGSAKKRPEAKRYCHLYRRSRAVVGLWPVGSWLWYGTTEMPRVRPDGSVDAKAFSADMIREVLASLTMKPSINGKKYSFWMKFGTASVRHEPFIWSKSQFASLKGKEEDDCVPDALEGKWNRVRMFME